MGSSEPVAFDARELTLLRTDLRGAAGIGDVRLIQNDLSQFHIEREIQGLTIAPGNVDAIWNRPRLGNGII
jgi:hypothetical protein